jgi:hypothetical protein
MVPNPGSGAAGHRQPLGLERLMMLPASVAHDLGQPAQQRLDFLPARERGGGRQLAKPSQERGRESIGSSGLRQPAPMLSVPPKQRRRAVESGS